MASERLLNVGCGSTYHSDWVNLDAHPVARDVMACDIRRGLPFPDAQFTACYSSHVLEHLEPADGQRLLREMYRVLEPDGVVRIVVPDLELVARDYLHTLERAVAGEARGNDDYDWMMIQLLDQSVRRRSGGEMFEFWRNPARRNVEFVVARAGLEAEHVMASARVAAPARMRRGLLARLRSRSFAELLTELRLRAAGALVSLIAGRSAASAYQEGLFRNSGEIHQWMYDRYSLARALAQSGFTDMRLLSGAESRIPRFASFEFDVVAGRVRKPDSLFMEAVKTTPVDGGAPRATVQPAGDIATRRSGDVPVAVS